MHPRRLLLATVLIACATLPAQQKEEKRKGPGPEDLPTSSLISQSGPSFRVPQSEVAKKTKIIIFGDQRFTDPENTKVTNPKARRLLVAKIAAEHPDAILMNGDVPYSGDHVDDYAVYKTETAIWRDEHLHIYPALGNHEFHGDRKRPSTTGGVPFPNSPNAAGTPCNSAMPSIPLRSIATLRSFPAATNSNGSTTSLPTCQSPHASCSSACITRQSPTFKLASTSATIRGQTRSPSGTISKSSPPRSQPGSSSVPGTSIITSAFFRAGSPF